MTRDWLKPSKEYFVPIRVRQDNFDPFENSTMSDKFRRVRKDYLVII